MPLDPYQLGAEYNAQSRQQRCRRCLAFCSVLRQMRHATDSAIAMWIPPEAAKMVCEFAFDKVVNNDGMWAFFKTKRDECVREQMRCYRRHSGKIVFNNKATVGERIRESRDPCYRSKQPRHGTIISLECDHQSEVAVRWDDGSETGDIDAGRKCGKKGFYHLVYE